MPRKLRGTGSGTPDTEPRPGEVYFEFQQVGHAMRVTAVDAATGLEVVIVGPASASQSDLQKLALRKLEVQLEKDDRK